MAAITATKFAGGILVFAVAIAAADEFLARHWNSVDLVAYGGLFVTVWLLMFVFAYLHYRRGGR